MASSTKCHAQGRLRELLLALGALPIEMGWCVGESLLMPFLLQMDVPASLASLVWLINPILGSFLQPLCGLISDRYAGRWGRRKPFLLLFAALASLGMLAIIFSHSLAKLMTAPSAHKSVRLSIAIIVCFGFGIMDISHDLLLTPTRALLNDSARSSEDLLRINNLYTVFALLGRLSGFFLCTFLPEAFVKRIAANRFFACLVVTLGVLIACVTLISFFSGEKRAGLRQEESVNANNVLGSSLLWELPKDFFVLWVLQFGGWLVINNFCFFFSAYCATCVFKSSDPTSASFSQGVLFASSGFLLQALVSILTSLATPALNRNLGTGRVYCIAELLGAASIGLTSVFRGEKPTLILISLCGVTYAIHSTNAFILLESLPSLRQHTDRSRGLLNGYLNNAMVYAQISVAVIASVQNYLDGSGYLSCSTLSSVAWTVAVVDVCMLIFYPETLMSSSSSNFGISAASSTGFVSRGESTRAMRIFSRPESPGVDKLAQVHEDTALLEAEDHARAQHYS